MHSNRHLWDEIISDDNIMKAIVEASRGKTKREDFKIILQRSDEDNISYFRFLAYHYTGDEEEYQHKYVYIHDGISNKRRRLIKPTADEQILHHMVMIVVRRVILRSKYIYAIGSVPNAGCHYGKSVVESWIRKGGKDIKYCLKMDIKKFFDSVDQNILIKIIQTKIQDKETLRLLISIIHCVPTGLPLGLYTSPWLAHLLLEPLDRFIKEVLKVKYYIRYVDDMVIFGSSNKILHKVFNNINDLMTNEYKLQIKENWQIFRFDYIDKNSQRKGRPVDFLGFQFYRDKVILRRKIYFRIIRLINDMRKVDKSSIYQIRKFMSYLGWLDYTDTYNFYLTYIKPFIDIKSMKKRISNYDRRISKSILNV